MREVDLREYERSGPHPLSAAERDALRKALPSLTIEPVTDGEGVYSLTPGSTVGAVEIGGLSVLIKPKIPIPQLLSLVCYAMSRFRPQRGLFDYPREYALPDVLALALASAATPGVLARAAARVPHGGGGSPHRARAHHVRRADSAKARHRPADRGAVRRVHRRHPGEPAGEGCGVPARRYAAALAGGADRVGLGRRDARQRLADGVPA